MQARVAVGSMSVKAASAKDANGGDATAFQHRHYAFIARVINGQRSVASLVYCNQVALDFADAFAANPRFDRARFLRACGATQRIEPSHVLPA